MLQSAERRRYPRKQVNAEVYIIGPGDHPTIEKVCIRDLSLGGMAMALPQQTLSLGQRLNLCFAGDPASCDHSHFIEASIVGIRGDCVGVAFESVGVKSLQDIQALLRGERFF